jgi:hypothetical protein
MRVARDSLLLAKSQMNPLSMATALSICESLQYDRCAEIAIFMRFGRDMVECDRDAERQIYELDIDAVHSVIGRAATLGFSSPTISQLYGLVYGAAHDKLLQARLKAAVAAKNTEKIGEFSGQIKNVFFDTMGDMFRLGKFAGLKTSTEWAATKVLTTQRQALAESFMVFTTTPFHSALTRDAPDKLARALFRTVMCFMSDRQNNSQVTI